MKSRFDVWIEGYRATGEHGTSQFLGNYEAENFKQACQKALTTKEWDMKFYDEKENSFWGCRFFDNETDAHKSFG